MAHKFLSDIVYRVVQSEEIDITSQFGLWNIQAFHVPAYNVVQELSGTIGLSLNGLILFHIAQAPLFVAVILALLNCKNLALVLFVSLHHKFAYWELQLYTVQSDFIYCGQHILRYFQRLAPQLDVQAHKATQAAWTATHSLLNGTWKPIGHGHLIAE